MNSNLSNVKSVIAINIDSVKARAFLFEIVEGKYCFIALGEANSYHLQDNSNLIKSIFHAIYQLEDITSRKFIGDDKQFIVPSRKDGTGVDQLILTYTGGKFLNLVITGLMEETSILNAKHLVNSTYTRIVDVIGLNDPRRQDMQIDAIIHADPDLVLFCGGTDNGASQSVSHMADLVTMVCKSLPFENRPEIFYTANDALEDKLARNFEKVSRTHISKNILNLDRNNGNLEIWDNYNEVVNEFHFRQYQGVKDLCTFCSIPPMPSSHGIANMVRFFSQIGNPDQTVLCVEVSSDSTSLTACKDNKLAIQVCPFGTDIGFLNIINQIKLPQLQNWLPESIPTFKVRDYLYQKSLFPDALPFTKEALMIEDSLNRCLLQHSLEQFQEAWPWLDQTYETFIVSGDFISEITDNYEMLLTLLDGIQPVGISNITIDKLGITGSLGAIARINPYLPAQIIETGIYTNLGTVICPISKQKYGTPILNMRINRENGEEERITIKKGQIFRIPLEPGMTAKANIQCLKDTVIDNSNQRFVSIDVEGGQCGLVIDARGRPIEFPNDENYRKKMIKTWHNILK